MSLVHCPTVRLPLVATALLAAGVAIAAPIPISQFNVAVTQNFDSLASSGTSSAMPGGWTFSESGTNANTTYSAGTGSATTGDTYSFGASGSGERALGTLLSGSLTSTLGASFVNSTGGVITQVSIAYAGEQWRLGATGRTDRLDFAYSLTGTTWTNVDALDFLTPNTSGAGAKDGNAAGNRTSLSHTITGLSLANGGGLWLRWSDFDASSSDDGLGIDDFSIMAVKTAGPTGGGSNVPDTLPLGTVAVVLVGLLWVGAPSRRGAGGSPQGWRLWRSGIRP